MWGRPGLPWKRRVGAYCSARRFNVSRFKFPSLPPAGLEAQLDEARAELAQREQQAEAHRRAVAALEASAAELDELAAGRQAEAQRLGLQLEEAVEARAAAERQVGR